MRNIPPLLTAIDEKNFSEKPLTGKWSKKEIIGHLIESATIIISALFDVNLKRSRLSGI
jgi:hypothetical protein